MLNVFLVDDEYFERLSLKNSIPWQQLGMQVIGEANNGLTAYEMIINSPPDIAIVDINMPKLNGLELLSKLNEKQIDCKYIILTGYDEFKYAQQAIRLNVSEYILKPINYDNLITTLNELRSKIVQNKSVNKQLSNLYLENERLSLERYFNDLVNCNFNLQTIEFYDKEMAQKLFLSYENYQVVILQNVSKIASKELYQLQNKFIQHWDSSYFTVCLDNKYRIFFILNTSALNDSPHLITDILHFAENEGISFLCGVGNPCHELEKLYLSYNEACIALQNCSVQKQTVVYYHEIHNMPIICLTSQRKNMLRSLITAKDLSKIKDYLKDMYCELEANQITWDSIMLYTLELINLLNECLSNQTSASISILNTEGSILDTLNTKKNITELANWLTDIYISSISIIAQKNVYSDITLNVETYINKHYIDPELSITAISKALYVNYSYLCYCFKRDKQMTINDYINQIRITKAIELFQNHTENIGFVAEKTGFSSSSYFSKQFKKATGLSPSEYLKTI